MTSPNKQKPKLIIVDGNSLVHRAYHALPPLSTKGGKLVNAVYGFAAIVFKVLRELKPTHMAVAFDKGVPTFRHEAYAAYKAKRPKQPQELYDQIPIVKDFLTALGVPTFEKDGYEADDLIATVSAARESGQAEIFILTGDLDALQLVSGNIAVLVPHKGVSEMIKYDEAAVKKRFGLTAKQMVDYKALRGDPSDNIPGVPGVGEKTATELLSRFGNLENLYNKLESGGKETGELKERIRKILLEHKKDAFAARELVVLRRDAPIDFQFEACQLGRFHREKLEKIFHELGFKTLLARLDELAPESAASEERVPVQENLTIGEKEGESELKKLARAGAVAVELVTRGVFGDSVLVGLALAGSREQSFVSLNLPLGGGKRPPKFLADFLENGEIKKYGHNLKTVFTALSSVGVGLAGAEFDLMLASYVLNPGSRAHDLETIVFETTGETLAAAPEEGALAEDVARSAMARSRAVFGLVPHFEARLKEQSGDNLFHEMEMPLVPVLARMEMAGVKIDSDFLKKMSADAGKRLGELSREIHSLAGKEFNINSPNQLSKILFDKLKLTVPRVRGARTATGKISTSAAVLEKLVGAHPIINSLLDYRELAKLQSTYLDALPALVNKATGRVHTTFNQTVTATGRLSSSNPNFQNIPIQSDLGKEIRKAFVAERGFTLLAADYSQIELRVVAALSGDKDMLAAFRAGEDIHTRTASEIWGVPLSEVKPEMRRAAKAINFGITYGMGAASLAESAGLSHEEAREFIARYFDLHRGIKDFLENTKALAAERGFVETFFSRRRYLPEINSGVPYVRAEAERMAINAPVQGTAADLIKMAMIKLDTLIRKLYGWPAGEEHISPVKMILQVHDELVFEVRNDLLENFTPLVREVMEERHGLAAPIAVEMKIGKNWGEMSKI